MALLLFVVSNGCGKSGPKNFEFSGTVTHNGSPVKRGFIIFEPDFEKGNSGPGGGAEIREGKYRTPKEKGVVGGAYKIKIVGFDGNPTTESGEELADGKPLFDPYHTTVEFPEEDTTKDFEVPVKSKG